METDLIIIIKKQAIFDLLNCKEAETEIELNKNIYINGKDLTEDRQFQKVILKVSE